MAQKLAEGFQEIDDDDLISLEVEFQIEGNFGSKADLEKRHRLEDRLNDLLGWTGLGHVDGGSIGSGTMEVGCLVVDFEIARKVIESDLQGSEFSNFSRIYSMG